VLYQDETTPTYSDRLRERIPDYLGMPPAKEPIMNEDGKSILDLEKISQELFY
jgi:hypothetical protein